MKSVIGLGNALTDISIHIESNSVLDHFGLPHGGMKAVDIREQENIDEYLSDSKRKTYPGGSASNTMRAMAKLGIKTGYIGKVGHDKTGNIFEQSIRDAGIKSFVLRGNNPSGCCFSLISHGGERTLCTYLGAAAELTQADITKEMFAGFDCLYLEGFLVQDHDLIYNAGKMAKESGMTVALDLASYNVVEENLDFIKDFCKKYVDIIFANCREAEAFSSQNNPIEALDHLGKYCTIVVIKDGAYGTYIKYRGHVEHVRAMYGVRCIDSTGAGDIFAAGFLAGLCKDLFVTYAGTIGAIMAGEIVETEGTIISEESWGKIYDLIHQVENGKFLL